MPLFDPKPDPYHDAYILKTDSKAVRLLQKKIYIGSKRCRHTGHGLFGSGSVMLSRGHVLAIIYAKKEQKLVEYKLGSKSFEMAIKQLK